MYRYIYRPYTYELYHHGIKGQKWGIRRFQNKNGSLTAAGKNRYSDDSDGKTDADSKKRGLTDKQKKAIKIGVIAVGTGLAMYGGYKLYRHHINSSSAFDPETGFRLIDKNKNLSDYDNLQKVNPGRIRFLSRKYKDKEIISGSSYNCMLCTTAYDLRKRGYDVRAGLSNKGYMPDDLFSKIYKGYSGTDKLWRVSPSGNKLSPEATLGKLEQAISKHGPGSRGNIVVWWDKVEGGHSMIWENVDGKAIFKDGQTGQVYTNFAKEILSKTSSSKAIEMLRTDNLDINLAEMKRVVNMDTAFETYAKHGAEIAVTMATDPVVEMGSVATYLGARSVYSKVQERKETKNAKQTKIRR